MDQREDSDEEENSNADAGDTVIQHEDLLQDLRAFVSFQGSKPGEATTEELLQKFSSRLPSHQTPIFKAGLICMPGLPGAPERRSL